MAKLQITFSTIKEPHLLHISFTCWFDNAYWANRRNLSFLLLCLPWVIPHSTTTISNSSFCFTFAYRSITVEFLRVASPVRISTKATCCAQMPLSVVAHVRDRVSELLSLSPSLLLSFSLSFFIALSLSCLPLRSTFLKSPSLSDAFVLSSLSSFVFFPLAKSDRMPFVCDVSTLHVLLVVRRPETSHSVAPF